MPKWDAWLSGLADVLGPLLLCVPPNLGSKSPSDVIELLKLVWQNRGINVKTVGDVTRLMTMSIADLLDDWFESPQVKSAMAVNGVIGTWAGPYEPGTAYVMAHHSIGDVGDGHLGNWGFPEGGMGAVADAIKKSALQIRRRDTHRFRRQPTARQAVARCGERCSKRARRSTPLSSSRRLHPKTAFLDHIGANELPDDFVHDIENWKTRSGVVKINLALGELPDFIADPGNRARRAPHGFGRDGAIDGVHRARVPRRPRGSPGVATLQ